MNNEAVLRDVLEQILQWVPFGIDNMDLKERALKAYAGTASIEQAPDAEQSAALSQEVKDHCWKSYKQGQISADHTAKQVFEEVLQGLANWLAKNRIAEQSAGAGQVAVGYVALPVITTIDMEIAGMEESLLGRPSIDDPTYVLSIYRAMQRAAPPAPTVSDKEPVTDDLTALVVRLARALRKAAPDNDLSDGALDYLKRKGLQGSPLRQDSPASDVQTIEGGWLVERDSPAWYLTAGCDGRLGWSPIPEDGLRFSRKTDGEAMRKTVKEAERVCYHDWVSLPSQDKQEGA